MSDSTFAGVTVNTDNLLFKVDDTIRASAVCIDRYRCGIVLVVDDENRLIGTITDGDIRRAMLAGESLDAPISVLLARKGELRCNEPVVASVGTPNDILRKMMLEKSVRHIPLVDGERKVVGLRTLDELLQQEALPIQAVIMAGGYGTRLHPLTEDMPKPMLPVGGRPLLEQTIRQLQMAGVRHVNVSTHYKPKKIMDHFGDGSSFGVQLHYVNEDEPLGTGGALGLLPIPREPLLVINGDILTQVNYEAMFTYHNEHSADMTIAVRRYDIQIPYGVIECDGPNVSCLTEKPEMVYFVNAGIYLLEPSVYHCMPSRQHFHMTDLIQILLNAKRKVVSFPIREYWLDIGKHADYAKAQMDYDEGKMI